LIFTRRDKPNASLLFTHDFEKTNVSR